MVPSMLPLHILPSPLLTLTSAATLTLRSALRSTLRSAPHYHHQRYPRPHQDPSDPAPPHPDLSRPGPQLRGHLLSVLLKPRHTAADVLLVLLPGAWASNRQNGRKRREMWPGLLPPSHLHLGPQHQVPSGNLPRCNLLHLIQHVIDLVEAEKYLEEGNRESEVGMLRPWVPELQKTISIKRRHMPASSLLMGFFPLLPPCPAHSSSFHRVSVRSAASPGARCGPEPRPAHSPGSHHARPVGGSWRGIGG